MSAIPKYTSTVVNAILESIRLGQTYERACLVAGITEQTFWAWRNPELPDYKPELADLVKKAQAEAVEERLAIIRKAAKKTWTAAAWWLERTHPKEFGRPYGDNASGNTTITTVVCPPDWRALGDAVRVWREGRRAESAAPDTNGHSPVGNPAA